MKLVELDIPEFGHTINQPEINNEIYENRLKRFKKDLRDNDFSSAVIYADREHFANMHYLSNFDPRFEEALLIINAEDDDNILITGPENQGYSNISKIKLNRINYPTLGLLSQDRSKKLDIFEILKKNIKNQNKKIGLVGWKYFTKEEFDDPKHIFDLPHYIIVNINKIFNDFSKLINITSWFNNPNNGYRAINEIDELAYMEYSSCHTSNSIKNVLKNIKEDISEFEAASYYKPIGIPLSCHMMFSTGDRVKLGLSSPSSKIIKLGDPYATAYGVWGALNCRVGWIAKNEKDLPSYSRDYFEKLIIPYCSAVKDWYENISLDSDGGLIFNKVMKKIGDPFFGVELNPGHLIHKDEWLSSPIFKNSDIKFRSRQAIQMDIIPATNSNYFSTNLEDGIFILNKNDKKIFNDKYPQAMERIELRREFMINKLGINLQPEIMPLSNIPAVLSPFILNFNKVVEFR